MISDYGVMLPDGPSKFLLSRVERHPGALGADYLEPEPSEAPGTSARPGVRAGGDKDGSDDPEETQGFHRRESNDRSGNYYQIHMSEGRNRQIRRTFAALGYTVIALHRTQFGNYSLGDIKSGEHTLTNIQ
jgi:pseudouridine synthase